ncbi:MAG: sigma-70 family RNA polymerase sigma factor [Chitinophagaceae bacterium]
MNQAEENIINYLLSSHQRRQGEESLFNTYSYFIDQAITKYSISPDEAFDAYSDTILTTIWKIVSHSFEGRSSLKTFVYQIFHNKCVDLLRKKTTNKNSIHITVSISDLNIDISDAAKSSIQKIIDKSDMDMLSQRLGELGDNCRQLLMLSADGYTDKEIAAAMKYKTSDVVKTSRLRCLERLRNAYKQSLAIR